MITSPSIETIKLLFSKLSIKELNNKINFFREYVSIRDFSEERIKTQLEKILSVKHEGEYYSFFLTQDTVTHPHATHYFYRIRKFTEDDLEGLYTMSFPSIKKKQHVLCRPKEIVDDYGRLHGPGMQVLYVSSEISNAIYETGCNYGDYFFLIVYQNINSLRLSQIHHIPYIDELTEEENAKRIIMHNFLHNEFTKFVPKGRKCEYKISRLIYEEYFSNPFIDGFCYPSIASTNNRGYNLCFTQEKAEVNLENIVVSVCRLCPSTDDSEFNLELFYDGFLNIDDTFTFYKVNSDEANHRLGNYKIIRDTMLGSINQIPSLP